MIKEKIWNVFGITKVEDVKKEQIEYTIGNVDEMPIALFMALTSYGKESLARFLTLITFEGHAKELAEEYKEYDNLKSIMKEIKEKIDNKSIDKNDVSLSVYNKQFMQYLAMKTPGFNYYESGVYLCCPQSYIDFWNQKEFINVKEVINSAIIKVVQELATRMENEGIKINKDSMTIYIKGYKPMKVIDDYGNW